MGFFDFLKRRPAPALAPAATLEGLLQQAASDPAYLPEFYRRLLHEQLVVITADDPATAVEYTSKADGNTSIRVVCWEDGRIPVFTSPERVFDRNVLDHRVAYAQMKGRAVLEMLRGATLLLNPYSDFCKELLPEEIARLLNGESLVPLKEIIVAKQTTVLLGQPAVYPATMTQALARLLGQQPRVKAAYLGWIHDPTTPEPPHYIICLNVEGEMRNISRETGLVAQQFLKKGEIIDIVQADKSGLTSYFRGTKPFYERG